MPKVLGGGWRAQANAMISAQVGWAGVPCSYSYPRAPLFWRSHVSHRADPRQAIGTSTGARKASDKTCVQVLYTFTAKEPGELSVAKGDVLNVSDVELPGVAAQVSFCCRLAAVYLHLRTTHD